MLAARTINKELPPIHQERHALFGMAAEIGELQGLYQKRYQGHFSPEEHFKKEIGDCLWFIAEYCTAKGWELEEIMQINIDKLLNRYPGEGFEAERSINRAEGDV